MKPFHSTPSILSDKLLETNNDFTSQTTSVYSAETICLD